MPPADNRPAADRIWFSSDPAARLARAVLAPASLLYAAMSTARNALYDAGVLPQHALALPAVSVGNLSVGGTGKTPVAAWVAAELARRGARPAVVLRGFGDDEPAVHRRLNPGAVIITDADRVAGVARARDAGADVAVLDDAFQHRRARRNVDIVLVSADQWPRRIVSLPAGPFREGLSALRRASVAIVTRKAASATQAAAIGGLLAASVPGCPVARIYLAPRAITDMDGRSQPLSSLQGRKVLAICGVGDPTAFAAQLAESGAGVELRAFPDHDPFSDAVITKLAEEAVAVGAAGGLAVCTLKDAVKLFPRWPSGAGGLSFLSQQVILEAGHEVLDRLLDSVLHARTPAAAAAG